jgi:hypothetical protein
MNKANLKRIDEIISEYNSLVKGIEFAAKNSDDRAYGGIVRSSKGKLVELICQDLVKIAWNEAGGKENELSFENKKIPIPIKKDYISKINSPEIKKWIKTNVKDFIFYAKVDIHIFINDNFVLGIECKSYTENAMLKRILVDFTLLKTIYPNLNCCLFQLESQLTGDYSEISKPIIYGSHSTHTLLSYFDIDLNIFTLLEGERKVDEPIHKTDFFKPLEKSSLIRTVEKFNEILNYCK